jgi:short-subunit dehydrogenase
VRAICVHPGGVKTNIARNARFHSYPTRQGVSREQAVEEFDRITMTTPERAAKVIHNGVKAGRSRILIGADAYLFDFLARTMPTHYYSVLAGLQAVGERVSPPRAGA